MHRLCPCNRFPNILVSLTDWKVREAPQGTTKNPRWYIFRNVKPVTIWIMFHYLFVRDFITRCFWNLVGRLIKDSIKDKLHRIWKENKFCNRMIAGNLLFLHVGTISLIFHIANYTGIHTFISKQFCNQCKNSNANCRIKKYSEILC